MEQSPGQGGQNGGGGAIPCQICGAAVPAGAQSCPTCHAKVAAEGARCQMCGGLSAPGAQACMICGASLVERTGPAGGLQARAAAREAAGDDTGEMVEEDGRRCVCGALSPLSAPACIVCGTRLVGPISYQLIGNLAPALEITLEPSQRVYGQTSCLGWMTDNVEMKTVARGSPWALLGRVASGMTMLVSQFSAPTGTGVVSFTPHLPGHIMALELSPGRDYIMQPGTFLAAQDTVSLHAFFTRNIGAGLFGGEGFILQRISGHGLAFAQIGGDMVGYELEAGQTLLVDPGTIAVFESTVRFSVRIVKGITNIVFNQGLFLAELRGPGRIWVETMPLSRLIEAIQARAGANMGASAGIRGALNSISGAIPPI